MRLDPRGGSSDEAVSVKRLLSGIRPSGALHLGHHAGVLRQWLAYQDAYECWLLLADLQALATLNASAEALGANARAVVLDALAAGIKPERCRFVLQSGVPELSELTVFLQLLVRTGELRDNPTSREEARSWGRGSFADALNDVDFAFLGYPVSQAADVLAFSPPPPREDDELIVPVGQDQIPHVAFALALSRRFNQRYGPVFIEPQARTAPVSRLPGVDGGFKMGKTSRNAIFLGDPPDVVEKKVQGMFTDPLRVKREDPGHPDQCPLFLFRTVFGGAESGLPERREACTQAETDCDECKHDLAREILALLEPIRARRAEYERRPDLVSDLLRDGTRQAREVAQATLARVRDAMGLTYPDLFGGVRAGC